MNDHDAAGREPFPGPTTTDWGPALVGSGALSSGLGTTMASYSPTVVERFGRRIKLEYLGMISVYLIVGLLVFGDAPRGYDSICGAVGAFLVFLGIKKKTRDHLSGSLVLFASTLLARGAVVDSGWSLSYLCFASCVCAMEGYLEKRQEQSLALPVIFLLWIFLDYFWIPALGFVAAYLLYPWTERLGLRRRLIWLVGLSIVVAVGGVAAGLGVDFGLASPGADRIPLNPTERLLLVSMGLPTLLCLIAYWRHLLPTHRFNTLLFAVLAPFDHRLLAMFGMVAAITLSATVYRHSVDWDSLRPYFKHAEWIYFWIVTAIAAWALFA